jgi:hypothetical protein
MVFLSLGCKPEIVFQIPSYFFVIFFIIIYTTYIYGCMFCVPLLNFVNNAFLLLCMFVLDILFYCVVLCIVRKCVLYYCHRVSIQLQLTTRSYIISHHTTSNKVTQSPSKPPYVFSQTMDFKWSDFVSNHTNMMCYTSFILLIYLIPSAHNLRHIFKNISFHCHKPGTNTIFLKHPFGTTHKASGVMITNHYHTVNAHCQATGYIKWDFPSFSLTSPGILLYRLTCGLGLSRWRPKFILFWRVIPWIMQTLLPWRLRQYVPPETCQISTRLRHISTDGRLPSKFQYLPTFTPVPQ